MRSISITFLLAFLVALSLPGCLGTESSSRQSNTTVGSGSDTHKVHILDAVNRLRHISVGQANATQEERRRAIRAIVEGIHDPYDLETLALISLAVSRHCTDPECQYRGNSELRFTFETTYWEAVGYLVRDKEKNTVVLSRIKDRSQIDGADAGEWLRIVEGKTFP